MVPAVDSDLSLVYFGTGNPVPQWGGEIRAGDNLYTESVIALDVKTGRLRWHNQLIHNDIWSTSTNGITGRRRPSLARASAPCNGAG
jgi:glucose dehydrogenase